MARHGSPPAGPPGEGIPRIDLAEVIRSSCDEARGREDVELRVDLPSPAVTMVTTTDPLALERMLRNLLDNAVRHARTQVIVALSRVHDGVQVDVRNDGEAIDPTDYDRIFQRFGRLDPARSPGGTGLGLPIARAIAEQHGGVITPGRDGGWTVFSVTLPREGIR